MTTSLRLAALLLLLTALPAYAAPDTQPPKITHTPVSRAPLHQSITVRAKIEDKSAIFAPSLLVRQKGQKEFETIELKKVGEFYEATIGADMVTGDLEYVIEAFDEIGNGPARAGSPDKPLRIAAFDPALEAPPSLSPTPSPSPSPDLIGEAPPPAKDDESVAKKWWFWVLIGAAAAGGTTAVILATRGSTPSTIDVDVRGPNPTSALGN
ncbi:MAG: hypothetical protein U1E65_07470 [Myxococcota bacterium]